MGEGEIELVFADPPKNGAGNTNFGNGRVPDPRWRELKFYPGKWVLWKEQGKWVSLSAKRRKEGYQLVSRNTKKVNGVRVCDTYVRYVVPE